MYYFKTILVLLVAMIAISCTKNKKTETTETDATGNAPTIKIKTNDATLLWTAYKFTAKAGVGGKFDTIYVDAPRISGTAEDILVGGSISIPTSSINSNNIIRDPKIRESFFGTLNTPTIQGKIISASDGKGEMELTMNGIKASNPYQYEVNDTALVVISSIDVSNWNGGEAISALNKVCEALHTGDDGTSKLWPDVDVVLSLPLAQ